MGDKIILKGVEIIQCGKIQIDAYNETKDENYRIFCEPDEFFKMMGKSMKENHIREMVRLGWVPI